MGTERNVKILIVEEDASDLAEHVEMEFKAELMPLASSEMVQTDVRSGIENAKGQRKAGLVTAINFTGTPKVYDVVFATAYPDTNYIIKIAGADKRNWNYENKATSGFRINSNANQELTGEVSWETIKTGE